MITNKQLNQLQSQQKAAAAHAKSKVMRVQSTQTPSKVERVVRKSGSVKTKIKPISESALQAQCVTWFKRKFPTIIIFAIPNAAKRSFRLAAKMKKEGMVSGIPDLFLAQSGITFSRSMGREDEVHHGLFIEMKRTPKDKTTDNQNYYLQKLQEAGYKTAVCHSFEEFQYVTSEYLK